MLRSRAAASTGPKSTTERMPCAALGSRARAPPNLSTAPPSRASSASAHSPSSKGMTAVPV
eukprot:6026485-Prymnesium_polylepis.4